MKPLLIIDLSSIFHAKYHAAGDGALNVTQSTIADIERCISSNYDRHIVIACDSKRSFRKDISPEYKANRERDATLYETLDACKAELRRRGFLLVECEGFEADDVIATIADNADDRGVSVTIASADKDLLQLVRDAEDEAAIGPRPSCVQLSTSSWKTMDVAAVREKFKVDPWKMGAFLALWGDGSDNIRGADGIGPVKAAELVNTYGDIDAIYKALSADASKVLPLKNAKPGDVSAAAQSLIDCKPYVDLARKLVALRFDAPVNFDEIYKPREVNKVDDDFSDAAITDGKTADATAAIKAEFPGATVQPANDGIVIGEVVPEEAQQTKAIAVRTDEFDKQLEPFSAAHAMTFADWVARSRLYTRLPNKEAVFSIIVRGRELGLGAMVSLDVFSIVEGKVCPSAHFIIAKAKAHPDCEYLQCIETTQTSSTWETKNRKNPKPTRLTYTIEQAKLAGRVKDKGQWERMPAEMCRKICGVQLARMEYPEAALGLYADSELDDVA